MQGFAVREIPATARTEWLKIIEELDGTPLHLPDPWLLDNEPADISLVALISESRNVCAAVVIRKVQRTLRLFTATRSCLMPAPPVLAERICGQSDAAYQALLSYAKKKGYQTLVIEPRWGDDPSATACMAGSASPEVTEFVLDLRSDMAQILGAMHKKHRKNIRTASDAGIVCKQDSSMEGMMILQTMQAHAIDRGRDRGNVFTSVDENYYRRAFDLVYRNGPGHLHLAFRNGKPLAALAYLEFGRKAITVRSGSSPEGYELSAMYLLQYELVKDLKHRGFEELNIGGVPLAASESGHPQHGLYDYKRYYGGKACLRSRVSMQLH